MAVGEDVARGVADPWTPRRIGGLALTAITIAIVIVAVRVLLLLFAGILLALVLRALSGAVSRRLRIPYALALVAIVLAGLSGTVGGVVLLAPRVSRQLTELGEELPAAVERVRQRVRRVPIVRQSTSPDGRELKPEPESVAAAASAAAGTTFEIAAGTLVVFFVGVYGAAQPGAYRDALLAIVAAAHRRRTRSAVDHATHSLTLWLLGRLVAMAFVFVTCAIAFSVMRVPLPVTLAVVAGLLTFVEYVGAVVSAVPPALLAFTKTPALAAGVLGVFTIIHVVEGYVLTPLLARMVVRIPPAFIIAGQVLLAALVGPLGLTFATPLFVVVASAVRAWRHAEEPGGASSGVDVHS